MGSRVSAHKHHDPAMKFAAASIVAKTDNLLIPSPLNVSDLPTAADVALKSQGSHPSSSAAASEDECFFESQPWLESDCEDDYQSVKGDFTPSVRSTPVHHKFSLEVNKPPSLESNTPVSEISSLEKKIRLLDLFKESTRDDRTSWENEDSRVGLEHKTNSTNGSPNVSGASFHRFPNEVASVEGGSPKSMQRCFPRFLPTCDRRKKTSAAKKPEHPPRSEF